MTDHEVEQLRRRMAGIRRDMDIELEGVVENAKTLTNWKYYLSRYPWLSIGAAAVVGYLIVPKKVAVTQPDAHTLAKLAKRRKLVVEPKHRAQPKQGLVAGAFNFMFGLAAKSALAWLGHQAAEMMRPAEVSQQAEPQSQPRRLEHPRRPQPAGPPNSPR